MAPVSVIVQIYHSGWKFVADCIISGEHSFRVMVYLFG